MKYIIILLTLSFLQSNAMFMENMDEYAINPSIIIVSEPEYTNQFKFPSKIMDYFSIKTSYVLENIEFTFDTYIDYNGYDEYEDAIFAFGMDWGGYVHKENIISDAALRVGGNLSYFTNDLYNYDVELITMEISGSLYQSFPLKSLKESIGIESVILHSTIKYYSIGTYDFDGVADGKSIILGSGFKYDDFFVNSYLEYSFDRKTLVTNSGLSDKYQFMIELGYLFKL